MDTRHVRFALAAALTVLLIGACSAVGRPAPSPSAVPTLVPPPSTASPQVTANAPTPTAVVAGTPTAPTLPAGVKGQVTAGPTCPVTRNPPDPQCRERLIAGAVIIATDAAGVEVARVTSSADGRYGLELSPGTYTLTPQDVAGLMGTAQPAHVTVVAGSRTTVDFSYDTGIR